MRMRRDTRSFVISALVVGFYVGASTDWWLREKVAPFMTARATDRSGGASRLETPAATTGSVPAISSGLKEAVEALSRRDLRLPLDNVDPASFKRSFTEKRGGRVHEAADMLAPRGTQVYAVEDGTIAKLFVSKAGGNTVYQFDPSERFAYYYAHLDQYAPGLKEGQRVRKGAIIGFVGTSGNAPPGTPHLHFAIFELTPEKRWWDGRAIDPFPVFKTQD